MQGAHPPSDFQVTLGDAVSRAQESGWKRNPPWSFPQKGLPERLLADNPRLCPLVLQEKGGLAFLTKPATNTVKRRVRALSWVPQRRTRKERERRFQGRQEDGFEAPVFSPG